MKKIYLFMLLCLYLTAAKSTYAQARLTQGPLPAVQAADTTTEEEELRRKSRSFLSFGVNESGESYDWELWWAPSKKLSNTGKLYLGLSLSSTFSTKPTVSGIYPFLGYKLPIDHKRNFNVWTNAGYDYTLVGAYGAAPSSSSGDFLWEVGADLFIFKNVGITVYSSEGKMAWFGLVFR